MMDAYPASKAANRTIVIILIVLVIVLIAMVGGWI